MKIANEKDLKMLAEKQQQDDFSQESFELSDDELELLYSKATKELKTVSDANEEYKAVLRDCFYGEFIFDETLTSIFFDTIDKMIKKLLPAILEGDYDTIYEELGGEISEESFETLRLGVYNSLKKRYI